jgi:hypothetical protein
MERRNLQDKEKMRKEHAAKIRETKMAMAQLAGAHWAGHAVTVAVLIIISQVCSAQYSSGTNSTRHSWVAASDLPQCLLLRCGVVGAADKHLESSTKRTLVENETMVAELAYHTAQVR